jgi:type I restriction enzyme S subunit
MSTALTHIKTKKQLIPELRFREFEGDWTKEKAGELCDCIVPGRNKPKQFDGDIAWITTPDIVHNSYIFNSKSGLGISKEEAKSVGSKIAPKNSVIISCVGDLGLVAIAGIELVINQQLHAFLPSEKVEYRFLMYSITTQGRYIDRVATKTAVPYMNKNNCNSIPVHLPTLPEQQKIASFLSAVDEKIQQLIKKKALLEQYKKGVMQQLFRSAGSGQASGQLRFKDENGNSYPDWEEKRLGEVCEVNPKNGALPSSFIYIDLESVEKGQLIKENRIDLIDAPSRAQRNLAADDILYQTVRPYQKNNLFFNKMGEYIASTGYAQLRAKESAMYIFQLVHHDGFVNKVLVRCTGTSYPAINSTDLAKINVSIPVEEEQQKIATYLSRIDTKIEAINNQITQTQTFKKGLLQQMFV